MDFKINNKTYVIYVPEDKKDYLYLVNKGTGKVDFRLLYSQAETFFGENLKDIKDEKIGLEIKKGVLEPVNVQNRAESVVAIWSNFKKRIMTPGALTEPERKNGIQENPNAGPAMNKLYDTIVSIQGNVASITAYSKKWFGETGDQKDSNANYNLTKDILESMRLFTSFYTIGKRQYGAKDNPFKNRDDYKNDENVRKLKSLINKIKTSSGAKFKQGLDIMDGLHFYATLATGGLARMVYKDSGKNTIPAIGRNVEKGLPQREDGSREFPFSSVQNYKKTIQDAPPLKDKIFFVKVGNNVKPKPYKDGQPYIPPAAAATGAATGASAGAKPQQESLKQKREKLLHEAIFKKLVR